MMGGESENVKTICSICFEDLKPIVEDLQSISICGHVFHELCLQQWFEYCAKGKKTCPVCKQACKENNVSRLYFQSVGDTNEAILSQKPHDCGQNPDELRREVKRSEGRISALTSALGKHQKDIKDITEELLTCKEQIKKEVAQKNEALKQNASTQNLLHAKSKEFEAICVSLEKSNSEYSRLQERNLSLAKELAALKLTCDLNLEEEDVIKLASLGNEAISKETVDVLNRSLVIRNKSYKELMAKYNFLGRGEARSHGKLEKAKATIIKLKARVQELEAALEGKENEVLRSLRTFKRTFEVDATDAFSEEPKSKRCAYEDQNKYPPEPRVDLDQASDMHTDLPSTRKKENPKLKDSTRMLASEDSVACSLQDKLKLSFVKDKDIRETCGGESLYKNLNPTTSNKTTFLDCHLSRVNASTGRKSGILVPQEESKEQMPSLRSSDKNKIYISPETIDNDEDLVILDDTTPAQSSFRKATSSSIHVKTGPNVSNPETIDNNNDLVILDDPFPAQPSFHIRKATSSSIPVKPGDGCFSGGLLGPDGTNWHLGKWCKKAQNKGSKPASNAAGDLIAVGADGRGGRIKVLRSSNHSTLDNNSSASQKRVKNGVKASGLQSQGCLQIEHFFSRATQ